MKKSIIILLLFAAIGSSAQTKIKSKSALADSIWLNKGAIEIQPFLTTSDSIMVRSMDYKFTALRDTTNVINIEVRLYDKNAGYISSAFLTASGSLFLRWAGLINKLDVFTLKKRLNKQN